MHITRGSMRITWGAHAHNLGGTTALVGGLTLNLGYMH